MSQPSEETNKHPVSCSSTSSQLPSSIVVRKRKHPNLGKMENKQIPAQIQEVENKENHEENKDNQDK